MPNTNLTYCDITEIPCGDVYTVVVSPVTDHAGAKLAFCPKKIYSGNDLKCPIINGKVGRNTLAYSRKYNTEDLWNT